MHIGHSGLLLVAAGAFALLALTARGPLGLTRLCGPRLHGALDFGVALALAAAPIVPALRPDVTGIVVVELAALAWVRVATLTAYAKTPAGAAATGPGPDGANSERADIGATAATTGVGRRHAAVARGLGVLVGRSARRLPQADDVLRSGARRAGRHAARLQRGWRRPPG